MADPRPSRVEARCRLEIYVAVPRPAIVEVSWLEEI